MVRKHLEKEKELVIAIDGPAGAGKSTVAQMVADRLGYLYIDTGAMYRAVTWLCLKNGIDISEGKAIAKLAAGVDIQLKPKESPEGKLRVFVDGKEITSEIRTAEISRLVSPLSANPEVREVLVQQQRKLAEHGGVVLDGRDIGTVVLPNAEVKVFLTASAKERARRRLKDLQLSGQPAEFASVLKEIEERDKRDSTRDVAPLKIADDGIEVVTDDLSIDQVVEKILEIKETKC